MANALYTKAKQKFIEGSIPLLTGNIKATLVDAADYTINLATHDFLDDIPSGARVATSGNLAGKTTTDGKFNASATTFTAVTGDPAELIVLFLDTGTAATSILIAAIDTVDTGALAVTPNGGDIVITWPTDIFKLS